MTMSKAGNRDPETTFLATRTLELDEMMLSDDALLSREKITPKTICLVIFGGFVIAAGIFAVSMFVHKKDSGAETKQEVSTILLRLELEPTEVPGTISGVRRSSAHGIS